MMRKAEFFVAVCLALPCSGAHAAFVNITIENENAFFANHPNLTVRNAWNALGGSLNVYRIYANFDSNTSLDHVHLVFGSQSTPSFLHSSTGEFFDFNGPNPKGGWDYFDWPVHPSGYSATPELAWDTFAALGFGSLINQGGLSSGAGEALNHFQFNWINTSHSWHHGSNPTQADAVAGGPSGYRVGLFQATVAAGVDIAGQFAIDTGYGIFWGENTYFTTIPAPGALVMMSLIFMNSRARRRTSWRTS